MDAKAFKIIKQYYFWFDDQGGFMVYQLKKPSDKQGGIYLINVGGKDQIFTFGGLQNEAEEIDENVMRINISLPDQNGAPPFNVVSKYRFNQIISLFKNEFGEK